ncbi:hypothetical protein [Francisella sp. SYW-9]|uniref:hypothetical protein n=1 Tax=Francisella sp. SYW-9 TaxID=2610888 RepID=UPI00123DC4B2|nr:hypothetical protein [Francisella sp. SYW-9]
MLKELHFITNPFIEKIENTQDLEIKKETVRKMLTEIYKSKKKWFDRSFFKKNIQDNSFNTLRLYLNKNNEYCLSIQGWGAGYITPIHNHDTWSSSITIDGIEIQNLCGTISKPYPYKYQPKSIEQKTFYPGDTIELKGSELHQVQNRTNQMAISVVFFMKHPNTTNRVEVSPNDFSVIPWKINSNKLSTN